jgi:anaerobic dimethyl sulfoxide reductase subunit B (iron-sulfur subunit)
VDECVGEALHAGPIGELMDKASDAAAETFEQNPTSVIIEPAADEAAAEAAENSVITPLSAGD